MSLINEVPKHPLLIFLEAAIRCNLRVTILDSNTAETPVLCSKNIFDIIYHLDEIQNAVIRIQRGYFIGSTPLNPSNTPSKKGIIAYIYYNQGDKNFVTKIPESSLNQTDYILLQKLYDEPQFFHNIGYYDAKK